MMHNYGPPPALQSDNPLYDSSLAIAEDIIKRCEEEGQIESWSASTLSNKLRGYVKKGLAKMNEEMKQKKNRDDCIRCYVEWAACSMRQALSSKPWFASEDFGPLLAAGLEDLNPKPFWANTKHKMTAIKNQIYRIYDENAKTEDFEGQIWATVQAYVPDEAHQGTVNKFLNKTYKKYETEFESPTKKAGDRTLSKFVHEWMYDAMWRIWQRGDISVPLAMMTKLMTNLVRMQMLPSFLLNDWVNLRRDTDISRCISTMLRAFYKEGNCDPVSGRVKPYVKKTEPAAASGNQLRPKARGLKREREESASEENVEPERKVPGRPRIRLPSGTNARAPAPPVLRRRESEETRRVNVKEDSQESEEVKEEEEKEPVCCAKEANVCDGTRFDRLIREKGSGWIYCEPCFQQLNEQQLNEEDGAFEGVYLDEE